MSTIDADPEDWITCVASARDGAIVRLRPGAYRNASLTGISKSTTSPVVIEGGGVTFSGRRNLDSFRPIATETAQLSHRYGTYPGVYPIAGEATLRLSECRGLVFRNIQFIDSWPTAVHIDRCTDLRFEDVQITGSSFAFYAVGAETARLVLRRCNWLQDPTRRQLWSEVPWEEIHEKYPDDEIGRYNGNRAYDGSYFLGRDIAGDVEIDDCTVEHAFNGVHLFNRDLNPLLSRNIHVHHCRFKYIRDNVFEPEDLAFNWWFHDNEIFNCHKPFSLELPAGGWLYVFRNRAWFDDIGGPKDETHSGGALLKLLPDDRRLLRYPGPVHFFNNSWFTRSPIAKSGSIARLAHHNNAIVFCRPDELRPGVCSEPSVFGKFRKSPPEHFTKNWDRMGIRFFNDIVRHPDWPDALRAGGYPILDGLRGEPEFDNPREGRFELGHGAGNVARNAGRAVDVEMPGARPWCAREPFNVGWYQDEEHGFAGPQYRRMPDDLPGLLPLSDTSPS